MPRCLWIALLAGIGLAGCAQAPKSPSTSFATERGVALLQAVPDVAAKRAVARMLCTKAGLKQGTPEHAQCVSQWHSRDPVLSRLDRREQSLRRRQLCLEPDDFTLVQCLQI